MSLTSTPVNRDSDANTLEMTEQILSFQRYFKFPAISLLDIYLRKMKVYVHTKTCT